MEYQNNLNISNRLSYQQKANGNLTTTAIGDTTTQTKIEYDTDNSTLSKAALALKIGKLSFINEIHKGSKHL